MPTTPKSPLETVSRDDDPSSSSPPTAPPATTTPATDAAATGVSTSGQPSDKIASDGKSPKDTPAATSEPESKSTPSQSVEHANSTPEPSPNSSPEETKKFMERKKVWRARARKTREFLRKASDVAEGVLAVISVILCISGGIGGGSSFD
ncbi:hypothetical protein FRC01_000606 [Tulasnella sp. 417]|nr:hypothetical protein FRC01_000606 [Tulasnella sp. 417]